MNVTFDLKNIQAIENIWRDPVGRTQLFFGKFPFHTIKTSILPYQLGAYLVPWGELYGFNENSRTITATGRGTGKSSIFQELNAADMACFMPYMLQVYYGEKKPIDVTIIFVANVKKGSKARLENVKTLIRSNPYLERHLVDYSQWTKERVVLRNGATLIAEGASDRARGYHSQHPKGRVIYLCDEFAFFGGSQCMEGQQFIEEIAEQSLGAVIGCYTTPYGKRGGAWWAYNQDAWHKFNFPSWANPRVDKKAMLKKVHALLERGRRIIVDQEIRGLFVDDVGLFFTMETWMKSLNSTLDWLFTDQDNYKKTLAEIQDIYYKREIKHGYFLLGLDPNKGGKQKGADPFGICLTEKVGRKYYNRFTATYEGRSHEEIMRIVKPLCEIFKPKKINFDDGGGYSRGPAYMLKGSPGADNINYIPESNASIVEYMSKLRMLMMESRYEQPPSESLKESQLAMTSIGDVEDISQSEAMIKFQTIGKKSGIPCDLAAMGLATAKENVASRSITLNAGQVETEMPNRAIETQRVLARLNQIGDMDLRDIYPVLTGMGH